MTDAALAAAAAAGDRDAASMLVRRYHDVCWRFAYRMLGNRHDVEDAVQETFLRALRALPRYREQDRFRAWLLRILANRCRTLLLQERRQVRRLGRTDAASILESYPSPAAPPDSGLTEEEERARRAELLQAALASLGPKYREALLLKHSAGLSYEEMEQVTGASTSALKMRVKRACEALRPLLEGIEDAH